MPWQLHSFLHDDELTDQLSERIADSLNRDIIASNAGVLAVSGGSTPETLFKKLAVQEVDWSKVFITMADERWLAENHPDANAQLVRKYLLQHKAAAARFVSLKTDDSSAVLAEAEINRRLTGLQWPLSTVILGMGSDGHTASLFPDAKTLPNALNGCNSQGAASLCCALSPPSAKYERITLTPPALLNCRDLILHIKGLEKREVLERAMKPGSAESLPIRAFLHQNSITLQIYYSEK